jgi:alpha-tubulin suppressor-like RCC1 family protein
MVRGPRARAVPKTKAIPEDGETLKAAMNGKLGNGGCSDPELIAKNPRKRGRAPNAVTEAARAEKRAKLEARLASRREHLKNINGVILTLGQGDTGQLGLGPDIMERSKPALVKDLSSVVSLCAGGMHTVCLTKDGKVYTFGNQFEAIQLESLKH